MTLSPGQETILTVPMIRRTVVKTVAGAGKTRHLIKRAHYRWCRPFTRQKAMSGLSCGLRPGFHALAPGSQGAKRTQDPRGVAVALRRPDPLAGAP